MFNLYFKDLLLLSDKLSGTELFIFYLFFIVYILIV